MRHGGILAVAVAGAATVAGGQIPAKEIVVQPGEPVAVLVDGKPARLLVGSGRIDRLTLDADFVAANRIKPTLLMGAADLKVAGRREFKGYNRPLDLIVAERKKTTRGMWFDGAPDSGADGTIGPWGLPQERVAFVLGPADPADQSWFAPLSGDIDSTAFTGIQVGASGLGIGIGFDVEDRAAYPVASAAAGALLARTFGGTLGGASWDVELLMGVKRPVRLLTLARPFVAGPFSFTQIAVRVRDRIDASGRGREIADADLPADPSEVVVEGATKRGPRPVYTLSVPRSGLANCSRITFDKTAKQIEMKCRRGN